MELIGTLSPKRDADEAILKRSRRNVSSGAETVKSQERVSRDAELVMNEVSSLV